MGLPSECALFEQSLVRTLLLGRKMSAPCNWHFGQLGQSNLKLKSMNVEDITFDVNSSSLECGTLLSLFFVVAAWFSHWVNSPQ